MQLSNEIKEFIQIICEKRGETLNLCESIIGEGHSGNIWKLSDEYCLKIAPYKKMQEYPESIKTCPNLCIPAETYVSVSGKYSGSVQRFLNSYSLQKFISENVQLSEKQMANIAYDILNGLAHLHKNGYVHRDFHPGNVMLDSLNGKISAVIIDFDEMQKSTSNTKACFRFNGYHAPEIVFYDEQYDARSEIFALGIMIWELLFGNCTFAGYNFFGRIISKSWTEYEKKSDVYNKQVVEALKTLTDCMKQTKLLSAECSGLLCSLLSFQKKDRLTATEALKHDFFRKMLK